MGCFVKTNMSRCGECGCVYRGRRKRNVVNYSIIFLDALICGFEELFVCHDMLVLDVLGVLERKGGVNVCGKLREFLV